MLNKINLIKNLQKRLPKDEAKRQLIYDDANGLTLERGKVLVGYPTIGVGRNLLTKGLSFDEIDYLLNNDILESIADVNQIFLDFDRWTLYRQAAITNMRFNLGPKRFRGFTKMIAAIHREDWERAALEALDSLWAKQVGRRAVELADMIKRG